jgi:hypothetical protein
MSQQLQVGRPSNSLHFVVGEMSGKLDQVLSAILLDRRRVEEIDARLGRVERWQWRVIGGVSVVVFIGGIVEAWHGR